MFGAVTQQTISEPMLTASGPWRNMAAPETIEPRQVSVCLFEQHFINIYSLTTRY